MSSTGTQPDLELKELGTVTPSYRHISKFIKPAPGVLLGDGFLKWYDIAPLEAGVPHEIHAMARSYLVSQDLSLAGDLGFVILHRCGESFYFLIVCTWRNDNEVWETVFAKVNENAVFQPFVTGGPHRPTYCVWELGAVWHEQQAWSRYLSSPRDLEAKQSYLNDSYEGPV